MRPRYHFAGADVLGRGFGQEDRADTPLCRALLGLWRRALDGVGMRLIAAVVALVRRTPEMPPSELVCGAVVLLRRARRWLRALRRRLAADPTMESERLDDAAERAEAPAAAARQRAAMRAADAGRLSDKPVLELMEGICADLAQAAALLGDDAAARYVAEVAAAARALLTGRAAEVLAEWSDLLGAATGKLAAGALVTAAAIAAPDSG